jgi:hypothetical protein
MRAFTGHRVPRTDQGVALVVSLLATTLIAGIGLGLLTMSTTERLVAGYARESADGLHGAEAIVERALDDLWGVPLWNDAVSGVARSSFVDSSTSPATPAGSLDLIAMTSALQARSDAEGRWGPNNPLWRLYAYGSLEALVGAGSVGTPLYLAAWVADDSSELDGNPATDSNGVVLVRGRALGRAGLVREVQITLKRASPYSSERPGGAAAPPDRTASGVWLARILRVPFEVVGSRQVGSPGVQILAWREVR